MSSGTKKKHLYKEVLFLTRQALADLGSCNVDGRRAFFGLDDFKVQCVADFEIVEHYAGNIFRMKEKVLCFAFAGNETKSLIGDKRFDSSCHGVNNVFQETRPRLLL